jgi:hypothetical protein
MRYELRDEGGTIETFEAADMAAAVEYARQWLLGGGRGEGETEVTVGPACDRDWEELEYAIVEIPESAVKLGPCSKVAE